jgi:hypothetical protein
MEKIGLIDSMARAVYDINRGRRGVATEGETEEGRVNFEKGHAAAFQAFQDATGIA